MVSEEGGYREISGALQAVLSGVIGVPGGLRGATRGFLRPLRVRLGVSGVFKGV